MPEKSARNAELLLLRSAGPVLHHPLHVRDGCRRAQTYGRAKQAHGHFAANIFDAADLAVATATGMALVLRKSPPCGPIATFPQAMIPLFGVGLSGAAHVIAFDVLRRPKSFYSRSPRLSKHKIQASLRTATSGFRNRDSLVYCNRGVSGAEYDGLVKAFERLARTRIKTDITTGEKRHRQGFGLIESWSIVERTSSNRMSRIELTLSEWL